jgi:hypothetical protein
MIFVICIPAGPIFDPRVELTLASLRCQDVEVKVAMCDVSNDKRLHELSEKYSDIICYKRSGPDGGQSEAINEGWRALEGDVYGWLNVDDFLAPNSLKSVQNAFERNRDIDIIYGQSLIQKYDRLIGLHSGVIAQPDEICYNNTISQPSCFVRKDILFDTNLLDENLVYTMDWDLWVRLYKKKANFYYLPQVLSTVTWAHDTKTASFNIRRYKEIMDICKYSTPYIKPRRIALSFLLEHISNYGIFRYIIPYLLRYIKKKNNIHERIWSPLYRCDTYKNYQPNFAMIPLYHYKDKSEYRLILNFRNCKNREIVISKKVIKTFETEVNVNLTLLKTDLKYLSIKTENHDLSDLISIKLE